MYTHKEEYVLTHSLSQLPRVNSNYIRDPEEEPFENMKKVNTP